MSYNIEIGGLVPTTQDIIFFSQTSGKERKLYSYPKGTLVKVTSISVHFPVANVEFPDGKKKSLVFKKLRLKPKTRNAPHRLTKIFN